MAAGDYIVRRNNANTDEVPNTGTSLVCLWDTSVGSKGSMSYLDGVFTLGETGRYLVFYSDQYVTASTTNNERLCVVTRLRLGGSFLDEGRSSGFIRKASGSQEYINSGAAIIEVTSISGTDDELEIVHDRVDDVTTASQRPDRTPDRSGVTILKLDDSWNYGRYITTGNKSPSTTDFASIDLSFDSNVQEDSPFTRTGADIDIASGNICLVAWSLNINNTGSTRSEYGARLTLDGSFVHGSVNQGYARGSQEDCTDGSMSGFCLIDPTSGQDLTLSVTSWENGTSNALLSGCNLQIVELPSSAQVAIVEATTGDINAAATDFTWDTAPRIDTAAFTHTTTEANVDVDNAGDYLVNVSMGETDDIGSSATRAEPAVNFRVNTTNLEHIGASSHARSTQQAEHGGMSCGGLLLGLSADDSIIARVDKLNSTAAAAIPCDQGGMQILRLSSVFDPPPAAPSIASWMGKISDGSNLHRTEVVSY